MASTTPSSPSPAAADSAKPVLPLTFACNQPNAPPGVHGRHTAVLCLFCAEEFAFPARRDEYLAHLYLKHHLIISEVDGVALLDEYLAFWREKFEAVHFDPKHYCTTMLLNHQPHDRKPTASAIEYFLLDDAMPVDREQRLRLHQRRLAAVLSRHQFERTDTAYSRPCLFCRDTCGPTRSAFVEHLFRKHFLHLGRPENLVYIDELLDDVRDKLARLVCLFCAKTFRDRPTLKEHMRKKGHKRINPDDKQYDKFYMVNYTREPPVPKTTESVADKATMAEKLKVPKPEPEEEESHVFQTPSDSDSDWSDWEADPEAEGGSMDAAQRMRCLFCAHSELGYGGLVAHMRKVHGVDLDARLAELTFHKKVKLVNYVRHQMEERRCVTCEQRFADGEELTKHLTEAAHFGTGTALQWDKPNFLFPLFEEDPLLFCLDDGDERSSVGSGSAGGSSLCRSRCESPVNMADGVQIYAEDIVVEVNEDAEALSREFMGKI